MTLTLDAKKRLERLQELTEADTLTEVVRKAIKLYDLTVQREPGSKIILKNKQGEQELIVL